MLCPAHFDLHHPDFAAQKHKKRLSSPHKSRIFYGKWSFPATRENSTKKNLLRSSAWISPTLPMLHEKAFINAFPRKWCFPDIHLENTTKNTSSALWL